MPLILGLLSYFAAAFAIGLVYHLVYRRRTIGVAAHLSAVFGFVVMLAVFVTALALDVAAAG